MFGRNNKLVAENEALRQELAKAQKALSRSRERVDYLCHSVPSFTRMQKSIAKMSDKELSALMTLMMDEIEKREECQCETA